MTVKIGDWVEITSPEGWTLDYRQGGHASHLGRHGEVVGKTLAKAANPAGLSNNVPEFLIYRVHCIGIPDIFVARWMFKVLQHAG